MKVSRELELAIMAACKAGDFLKQRRNIQVDSLEGKDIKLSSDKISEKMILDVLGESGIPVLSEECGFTGKEEEEKWIVDPLDGTINYFRGMDELSCVSIALWKDGKPVLGVVNRFMKDELFYGEEESGAFLNGELIRPSSITTAGQAIMATGFPVRRSYDTESLTGFVRQVQNFKKVRMLGAAAVMGAFVACGRVDAYFEDEIMIWDVAAAAAVVRASGGNIKLELLENDKCNCKCFATKELMEDCYAKGI